MWALLLGFASTGSAQDSARTVKLTGNLAYVDAAGNSEVSTFAFNERLEMPVSTLTFTQTLGGVYGKTEGETTASLWRAGLRGDVPFNRSVSAYGLVAYDRDRFAGISRRVEEGLGLGVRILHGPTDSLSLEGGLSFFQQRSTDRLNTSYTAARSGGRYKHLFSPSAYFLQLFEVLPNLDDFGDVRAITESSLVAPLSRVLALRLSLVMRYDSDPDVAGVKRLDRLFTAGIEVTF
jgi:putative salt-induced outer membrane protein